MRNLIILLSMLAAGWSAGQDGAAMMMVMGQSIPTDGLISYVDFEAVGQVVTDSIGGGSGTGDVNVVFGDYGLRGKGMFGGAGTATTSFGDYDTLDFAENTAFTLSIWAKMPNTSYYGYPVRKEAARGYYMFFQLASDQIVYKIAQTQYDTGVTDLLDNQWHHLAITRNASGSVKMYVDSEVIDSRTNAASAASTGVFSFGPIYGYVDEFRAYNRELTADEINQLYIYR